MLSCVMIFLYHYGITNCALTWNLDTDVTPIKCPLKSHLYQSLSTWLYCCGYRGKIIVHSRCFNCSYNHLLHLHEIMEGLYFHWSLSLRLCVCVCVRLCLWTKFKPNGYTDLDAVFTNWLLTALSASLPRALRSLPTLCHSQGPKECPCQVSCQSVQNCGR